jgi:cardiolipin synthase A/B
MAHRAVIILPDDTIQPVLDAIRAAKKSLKIKMFVFSHAELTEAVIAAKNRGIAVRVMLNPARRSGERENEATRGLLEAAGIEVKDSNPEFALTHEKSMIVDDALAFINSMNWETKNLTDTRDYAIITSHKKEVNEIARCFDADWNRENFESGEDARLIWCRGNGRQRIARFIDETKHSLIIQNERYQDTVIIERLVRAARRGVHIHIMARPPRSLKKEKLLEGVGGLRILDDVGIRIRKIKQLRLHGKMLLGDHSRAIIGSINLAPGSFDDRRELAIEIDETDIIARLLKTTRFDWENARELDLSDKGLLSDLKNRGDEIGEERRVLMRQEK